MMRLFRLSCIGLVALSFSSAEGGEPKLLATLGGAKGGVIESVAFSPDGKTLASGRQFGAIELWDVATGGNITALKGHTGEVHSVAFCPDGKTLASGSRDQTTRLWDVATGMNTVTINSDPDAVLSVAFSPDGKLLASASWDKTIKLWDVKPGKGAAK